jgi:hypothetical protein
MGTRGSLILLKKKRNQNRWFSDSEVFKEIDIDGH